MAETAQREPVTAAAWLAENPNADHITAALSDMHGVFRGKRVPIGQLKKALDGGLRMPLSILGVDVWGCDVLGNAQVFETGDADGVLAPTERGLLPITWTERPTALLPLWMADEDGAPNAGDTRRVLADVVARYRKSRFDAGDRDRAGILSGGPEEGATKAAEIAFERQSVGL